MKIRLGFVKNRIVIRLGFIKKLVFIRLGFIEIYYFCRRNYWSSLSKSCHRLGWDAYARYSSILSRSTSFWWRKGNRPG